jgi:recombination protein RecT
MATVNQAPRSGALAKRDEQFGTIRDMLTRASGNLRMALPKHMTPDRMIRIALTACSKNPTLMECTPQSIALSLINASETGLEPNGYEAHLIPYKNKGIWEAQFMPDYKGLVQLAYRSGLVDSFDAAPVYEKDRFDYKMGTDPYIDHKPSDAPDRGALVAAWACAKIKGGGVKFVVLNRADVQRRRSASKSAGSDYSPWNVHEAAMWTKSAAKELSKWIPRSAEMQAAIGLDDDAEMGTRQAARPEFLDALGIEDRTVDNGSRSDQLASRLGGDGNQAAESVDSIVVRMRERFELAINEAEVEQLYDEYAGPNADYPQEAIDLASPFKDQARERLRRKPAKGQKEMI